jgi:hypothetical protein
MFERLATVTEVEMQEMGRCSLWPRIRPVDERHTNTILSVHSAAKTLRRCIMQALVYNGPRDVSIKNVASGS